MGYSSRCDHDLAAGRLKCGIANCKCGLARLNNKDFLRKLVCNKARNHVTDQLHKLWVIICLSWYLHYRNSLAHNQELTRKTFRLHHALGLADVALLVNDGDFQSIIKRVSH